MIIEFADSPAPAGHVRNPQAPSESSARERSGGTSSGGSSSSSMGLPSSSRFSGRGRHLYERAFRRATFARYCQTGGPHHFPGIVYKQICMCLYIAFWPLALCEQQLVISIGMELVRFPFYQGCSTQGFPGVFLKCCTFRVFSINNLLV